MTRAPDGGKPGTSLLFCTVQSSCVTPVGTPSRSMLPGDSLQVHVPSADVSPQTVFGSLDPKGLAALQAAFHDSLAEEGKGAKVSPPDCTANHLLQALTLTLWRCLTQLLGTL